MHEQTRAALDEGLAWIFDTPQPAEAIFQPHGIHLIAAQNRHLGIVPIGWNRRPVITINVSHPEYSTKRYGGHFSLLNPIERGELEALADAIRASGVGDVTTTWNGYPGQSGSVGLARAAHPTLRATVDRYLRGCPTHRTVFCSREGCTWYADGARRVVYPPSYPRAQVS